MYKTFVHLHEFLKLSNDLNFVTQENSEERTYMENTVLLVIFI